jgi:hypothetical protein
MNDEIDRIRKEQVELLFRSIKDILGPIPGALTIPMGDRIAAAIEEATRTYRKWVNDLQAGIYVNCVYCGHRYGPGEDIPSTMADVLKEHVEKCPEHPMSKLKATMERWRSEQQAIDADMDQTLGKVLGYPALYPDASEVDDGQVCTAPNVPLTLAHEAAEKIQALKREVKYLRQYGNKDCTAMADKAMEDGEMDEESSS